MKPAPGRRLSAVPWEIPCLALLGLVMLGLLGVIARSEAERPAPPPELATLASPAPTATPTPGWWSGVSMTPPALGSLPGLPTVALSGQAGAKQGAPVSFRVLACPRADVKIEDVTGGERRGWWNLYGTAAIPNLWYWKGEISADGQGWQMLYRSETPVQGGLLIEFNTRTVPAGTYQVRLTAVDRTGNYPDPCVIEVKTESTTPLIGARPWRYSPQRRASETSGRLTAARLAIMRAAVVSA